MINHQLIQLAEQAQYIPSTLIKNIIIKSYITSDYEETEADIVYKANINNNEVFFKKVFKLSNAGYTIII